MLFRYLAVRFLPPAPAHRPTDFSVSAWTLQYEYERSDSAFVSSDDTLNAVFELARWTLEAGVVDTYTGDPAPSPSPSPHPHPSLTPEPYSRRQRNRGKLHMVQNSVGRLETDRVVRSCVASPLSPLLAHFAYIWF